jgi:hypothetical protein
MWMMVYGLEFWFNLNNIIHPDAFFKPEPAPSAAETGKKERDQWWNAALTATSREAPTVLSRIRASFS